MEKSIGNFTYSQQKYLGRGSYSTVYEGRNDKTHEIVAVKIIEKRLMQSQLNAELILGEIETMKTINHPNLVKMYEVYQTQNNIYLILEYCNQGDLDSQIKKGVLDEQQALSIMKQITIGYEYLYQNNIMHRDLKPSNIFIHNKQVKIADFGFALKTQQNQQVKTRLAGTPAYASPQMLKNHFYSYLNDMWSLGVLFYEMLHGTNPWPSAQNQQHLIQLMTTGQIQIKNSLSQLTKDLIINLLKFEECDRLSFTQLQNNLIFNQKKKSQTTVVEKSPIKIENINQITNQESKINENNFTDVHQLKLLQTLRNLNQNIFQLDYDTPNIVLQYVICKLIIFEGKKINIREISDLVAQNKVQFRILTSDIENQQFLSDILYTESEKIQDFSPKFYKFCIKQIQQAIRRFNHKLSIKTQHDQNDFRIIEFVQRLICLYQFLRNKEKNKKIDIIENIIKIDNQNIKQYQEIRNRIMSQIE